jgi:hypothetical protein
VKKNKLIAIFIMFMSYQVNTYCTETKKNSECLSSREFITSLNFLRSKPELGLNEKNSLNLAEFISSGCTGSAERFIKTLNLLTNAEIPSTMALPVAKRISQAEDQDSDNFQAIFKKVYIEKFFDLPAEKSLTFAEELTGKMDKDSSKMIDDFNVLSEFCLSRNGLDLGLKNCADIIFKVLTKTKNVNAKIGKEYLDLFNFLTANEKGPKLSSLKAIEEAGKVIEFGPAGITNFIQGYQFAISEKGLKSGVKEALEVGNKMASFTFKKTN